MQIFKPRNGKLLRKERYFPKGNGFRLFVVVGLIVVYALLFTFLIDRLGLFISFFLILPVSVAGSFFGRATGLMTGLFAYLFNIFLLSIIETNSLWEINRYWPGYLAIIGFGYLTGYLHDELIAKKRILHEGISRERFIALVSLATKSITSEKELENAYYHLITHLANLFVADYAYLFSCDGTNEQVNLVVATRPLENIHFPYQLEKNESSLIRAVLLSRNSMVIEDVNTSTYIVNPSPYDLPNVQTKSALVIPFVTEDYCYGAATLAFDSPRQFTPDEMLYVELASNQITLALRTLQQQLEIETQLKELEALANIERALSEAQQVGVDKVLQLIVNSAIELIPKAKNIILHLLDHEKQILEPRALAGITEATKKKLNMRLGEGVAGTVMATGKMITIADVQIDPRFLNQATPVQFRSLVVAPIKSHDECIGTISIYSDVANAFNRNEVALLEKLGVQVSIGIENANLLETLEQRVQQRTHDLVVLYNLITIISENWRLQDLLELSLVLTLETVKAERGVIYLVDGKDTPGLKPVIQRGFGEGFAVESSNLPPDELARQVLKQHKPFAVENLTDDPADPTFDGLNSYAGIPIMIRGDMRGVFSLYAAGKNVFGTEEMALLASIADHLGIGIDNSFLWEQSRESAALEERNRLARNLHDSVSQLLYSLTLMAWTTGKMLDGKPDLPAVKRSVARLGDTAQQALREMRLLLYELRPAVLDSEGLLSALKNRIGTVEERLGVKVELQADELPELPSDIEDALYHIALEALNNIVKHAKCHAAMIKLDHEAGNVVMEISDDGVGFDPQQTHHGQGLRNMRERVQILGGEVQVGSLPDKGTRIRVRVKLPSESLKSS